MPLREVQSGGDFFIFPSEEVAGYFGFTDEAIYKRVKENINTVSIKP